MRSIANRTSGAHGLRARLTRVSALVALAAAAALACQAAASDAAPVRAAGSSFFISSCAFSHEAPDDPIVFPGRPNRSHPHTFVGNVSTNAFSTLRSLRAAGTSCSRKGDTAAYWAPTLVVDGQQMAPTAATIYYRRLTIAPVKPFPPGLRMIAGDSHALTPQSRAVTYWACSAVKVSFYGPLARAQNTGRAPATGDVYSSGIPHCSAFAKLQLEVTFPDCWNGKAVGSADHRSHMAYSARGRCPSTHPVPVPAISLIYTYPPGLSGNAFLSSGGQYSGHADFINSWNQSTLASLVRNCLNGDQECSFNTASSSAR